MDCTAQWIHDVSAVTANDQLATGCSTRFHPHPSPTRNDVDTTSLFSISSRHTQPSRTLMRDLIPDGSESSNESDWTDSGPADEEVGDSLESPGPDDLDEPWPYTFRMGDSVWIRTEGGNWYPGKVSSNNVKRGQTRQKEALFYPVIFRIGSRMRKKFAPLNGEIKPDTLRTRILLRRAGWL